MLRRDFFLSVTLAAAMTTPAFTQTTAPPVGPAAIWTPNTAFIPDFSGMWAHQSIPGFEQPIGPGPVRNSAPPRRVSSEYQLIGDYTNPILKPHAAEEVKRHGEISLTGVAYQTQTTSAGPNPCRTFFETSEYRCCSSRIRSRSCTPKIMKSAACG